MSDVPIIDVQRYQCVACSGAIQVSLANGQMFSVDSETVLVGDQLYHALCWDSLPENNPPEGAPPSAPANIVRNPWHQSSPGTLA